MIRVLDYAEVLSHIDNIGRDFDAFIRQILRGVMVAGFQIAHPERDGPFVVGVHA